MKTIKQFLLAVVLATSALSAQATVYDLGDLSSGNTFFGNNVSGSFTDTFTFSLLDNSDTSIGATPLNLNFGRFSFLNINNLSLSLFDSGDTQLSTGLDFSQSLVAGNYYLNVSGVATGYFGGLYAGGINVTPVPEAKTYTMMLLGLGLIGFIARRRRAD